MKVLFIWEVPKKLQDYFIQNIDSTKVNLVFPEKKDENIFLKECIDADVIVGWRPTKELLDSCNQLNLFINPGAGVQHLAEPFNNHSNITIVNGHGNAFYTAEHIIAMLLSLTNRIIPHHQWMLEGKWRLGDDEAKSISLKYRTVGLLGYGKVNQNVHELLKPFGCSIKILKRNPKENQYGPEQLHDFLEEIDVLIIAIPLTDKTKGMISKQEIQLLGKQGLLINAGRGEIVNEEALFNVLKNKDIEGAAIDVWYNYDVEPNEKGQKFPYQYPFYKLDNILLSPHRAASPFDDLKRWDDVIENINKMAVGKNNFLNVVDLKEGY